MFTPQCCNFLKPKIVLVKRKLHIEAESMFMPHILGIKFLNACNGSSYSGFDHTLLRLFPLYALVPS